MTAPRPYTLVAELTYRCPLRCAYCSNPVGFAAHREEMDSATWTRVMAEAEQLGVVQLNLTGGEPLVRDDLEELIAAARRLELYVNLITSGVPLARDRLARLAAAGLDSVQLSLQDARAAESDRIAGVRVFERKLEAARWVKELGLPLTYNVVLHRENIDRVEESIALAGELGADRLELANAQYVGWGLLNRAALLPTREQVDRARAVARAARDRLRGRMDVVFVVPDYHVEVPGPCMDGWGRRFIVVSPDGLVLPCHLARTLPLAFDSARDRSLIDVWETSEALACFRGEDWMPDPCRGCERRTVDHGGCRCQAYHLTGDLRATDPACAWSPHHHVVERARAESPLISLVPRTVSNSRRYAP